MSQPKPLTRDQIESMKEEFLKLDIDGDGTITVAELEGVLRCMRSKLQASEAEIQHAIKDIDRDGDGIIELREYLKSRKDKTSQDLIHRALVQRSKIRKSFQRFDEDNSGYITKDEFMSVISDRAGIRVTADQVDVMLHDCDQDNDGKVNYEEFVYLMTK